jgi:hypothetical protein
MTNDSENRWRGLFYGSLVVMAIVIFTVFAGMRTCSPVDDDDSTEDIAAEFDELDAEFSDEDETYNPGVL